VEAGADAVRRPIGDAQAAVRQFCAARDRWVVEGCCAELIQAALAFGPALVFLNPGRQACLENGAARPWEPHKSASPEDQHAQRPALLAWVAEYDTRDGDLSLQGHRRCHGRYPGPKRELTARPALAPVEAGLIAWLRSGPRCQVPDDCVPVSRRAGGDLFASASGPRWA
jgi:hypothetical protein